AVKDIVPAGFKSMENKEREIAEKLFYTEHRELSEKVIQDMSETTNTSLVVGTLIVTLGITTALTIRTNTIQGRTPMFDENTWYIIFLLSVGAGVCLTFISIYQYISLMHIQSLKERVDYVNSRERTVMIANLFLMTALGTYCSAAMSANILIFAFFPRWTFFVIAGYCLFSFVWVFRSFRFGPLGPMFSNTAVF
ncbi:hypothetical protein PIB30_014822, partial [Stylosanthes scabra]|nr:hypothetical protein [Stylosanthes scabra]